MRNVCFRWLPCLLLSRNEKRDGFFFFNLSVSGFSPRYNLWRASEYAFTKVSFVIQQDANKEPCKLSPKSVCVVNFTGIRAKHNSSPPPCGSSGKQNACFPCSRREITRGRGRRKDILGRLGTIFIDSLTEGLIRPFVLYQDIMNGSLFLVTYCFCVVVSVLYLWFVFFVLFPF